MSGQDPVRYFLYFPVWATSQTPPSGGSDSQSSASSSESPSSPDTDGPFPPGSTEGPASSAPASSAPASTEAPPSSLDTDGPFPSSVATEGPGSSAGPSSAGPSSGGPSGPSGGSPGGGTGSGGTGPSGTGPGGTGPGGTDPGGPNCLLEGTMVRLASGITVPIESLRPGDRVAALDVPGLERDRAWRAQYEWLAPSPDAALRSAVGVVGAVRFGVHEGCVVVNARLRLTHEHPVLIERRGRLGFCSAELLHVGDRMVRADLTREAIASIEASDEPVRTVAVHVPGLNVFLAEGVWVHNDMANTEAPALARARPASAAGPAPAASPAGRPSSRVRALDPGPAPGQGSRAM